MLMEHETQKLKELDETYAQELKDWKQQLKPRKQVKYLKSKNISFRGFFRVRFVNDVILNFVCCCFSISLFLYLIKICL